MKKSISLFTLLILMTGSNYARKQQIFGWFHITPKVGIGTSLFINGAMFDSKIVSPNAFNNSYKFGGQMGATFMDMFDFSIEVDYNISNQLYTANMENFNYEKNLKFLNLDYGFVFRYMSFTGYYEIGGTISNVKNIKINNVINVNKTGLPDPTFEDNIDYFRSQYYNIFLGFGGSVIQKDLIEVTLGLRFKYGIQALATGPEFPLLDNVYNEPLKSNSKSRLFSAVVEINMYNFFGFFGRRICGKRTIILFQRPTKLW